MKSIAIITARGGSKRIPKKNIKDFLGKPIIAYSIEAAISSGIFDEVMVSTDSEEIAGIAKKYGASVPFLRSEKTSSDYATTNDVLIEVIDEYSKRGIMFDMAACLYPTAPFITPQKLIKSFEMLKGSDADTIIPVVQFSYPPKRALVIRDKRLVFHYPEFIDSRSQDLEPEYHDIGQFYFFKVEAFKKNRKLMVGNILPLVIDEMEVQDIDNISDWNIAEIKYKAMKEKEGN
ncbi:MAG: pseudaminic acid cytidylyltransferase [Lachnospiraceae bacterium]|nr:pseudaminic acid cytidylyltransferase [Lachnospiraceae bacterium]